jgi:hypothetical protein
MMTISELDERGQQFLINLFEQTDGDTSVQVSMYELGESLGLDRDAASRVAETLIGLQLVEIRTLSGGIGISLDGAAQVKDLMGGASPAGKSAAKLSDGPIMDQSGCEAVQQLAEEIKAQAGRLALNFDDLSALMADLKTIDAQLGSPKSKTAIIRECLRSLKAVLEQLSENEILVRIRGLLGSDDR